jgi:type II secretory pathway pseudopilin PulG
VKSGFSRLVRSPAASNPLLDPAAAHRHPRRRAFTLVEVLIASLVLTVTSGGILAMIIQSRRLTEGSIVQNSVVTIMQGYIEQVKSMEYGLLAVSLPTAPSVDPTIPTVLDEATPDPLTLSWGSPPPALPALGTTPTGAVTNIKSIAIKNPAVNPNDTLTLTIWVWVQDLTDIPNNIGGSKAVTMIYTYQFRDGGRIKSFRNSLRTIRSVVPSF